MSLRHDIEAARQHVLTTLTRSTPRSKIMFCQASSNRRTGQILPTPGPVQMHGPPSAPQISSGPPVYLRLGSKRSTKTKWPNTRDLNTQHMGHRSDPSRPSPSRVGRWLIGVPLWASHRSPFVRTTHRQRTPLLRRGAA
jgi:hypothetical protein